MKKSVFALLLVFFLGATGCVSKVPSGANAGEIGVENQARMSNEELLESKAIYTGVSAGEIDLSGLNILAAENKLREELGSQLEEKVNLIYGDQTLSYTLAELGYEIDFEAIASAAHKIGREGEYDQRLEAILDLKKNPVEIPVEMTIDDEVLKANIMTVASQVSEPGEPNRYEFNFDTGSVIGIQGKAGKELDQEKLFNDLKANPHGDIQLVIKDVLDEGNAEEIAKRVNGTIATARTYYNNGYWERAENIRVSIRQIDGLVIGPKETFSYNDYMGDTTPELGYVQAIVIDENDQQVPGYGGGVCQTSTTLYHAALKSGMEVINRAPHSLIMPYSDGGLDAAVEYGSADLALRNPYDFPIVVRAYDSPGIIDFELLGDTGAVETFEIWSEYQGGNSWTAYRTSNVTGETETLPATTYVE